MVQSPDVRSEERSLDAAGARIEGTLARPADTRGLVVFAHGSGSSRFSPRNGYVAQVLNEAGFATLLLDLLTAEEERIDVATRRLRFDIELLSGRVAGAIDWLAEDAELHRLPLGLFGASTGAAAALQAAAARPESVAAVVSRGGRPDLAGDALGGVRAPTLLIVGSRDRGVIRLNEEAAARLRCVWELTLVEGATHLFEEPGTLEEVAGLARDWFVTHLAEGA